MKGRKAGNQTKTLTTHAMRAIAATAAYDGDVVTVVSVGGFSVPVVNWCHTAVSSLIAASGGVA